MTQPPWSKLTLDLSVHDVAARIAAINAPGPEPVLFLHGFGSTKEEYADFTNFPSLGVRPFLAYDAPGFGESGASDLTKVSISFLVDVAVSVLEQLDVDRFHVVGHSMGGLTALMLADRVPDRVLSFTNIEGNLASEDCFLSRQIVTHGNADPTQFLSEFAKRSLQSVEYSSALYGSRVLATVDPHVARSVFESMVELSDHGDLLTRFTGLPMPRMFMHGQQNAHLSYLSELRQQGVRVAEIEHSGHWPMYSNPPAMWAALRGFLPAAQGPSCGT